MESPSEQPNDHEDGEDKSNGLEDPAEEAAGQEDGQTGPPNPPSSEDD